MTTIHQVWAVYFSATGSTRRVVCRLAREVSRLLGIPCHEEDLTPPDARLKSRKYREGDLVVFGLPVHRGRVPQHMLPCLRSIQGGGALAVPVVLYGNRSYGDALIELRQLLEADGFWPVAAGAFIGQHALSDRLGKDRPDKTDMDRADRMAAAIVEKLRSSAPQELLQPLEVRGRDLIRPYFQPVGRTGRRIALQKIRPHAADHCTGCGLCVRQCPMGALSLVEGRPQVAGRCIRCTACVRHCPSGAMVFDDPDYLFYIRQLEEQYPLRQEPSVFV